MKLEAKIKCVIQDIEQHAKDDDTVISQDELPQKIDSKTIKEKLWSLMHA